MDMQNITKITLAWELYEAGLLKTEIAKRLGVNRDTIRLWFKWVWEIRERESDCCGQKVNYFLLEEKGKFST